MPKFKEAWLDYCRYFNATKAEQKARYGSDFGSLLLFQGHSRLDAYAAVQTGDDKLAARAWRAVLQQCRHRDYKESADWTTEKIERPDRPGPRQRGGLGVHQRHRAVRLAGDREPRAASGTRCRSRPEDRPLSG